MAKQIYDVLVKRVNINDGVEKSCLYQVVADCLTMAVFCAGQVYHNDQYDILSVLVVSAKNPDELFEWNA